MEERRWARVSWCATSGLWKSKTVPRERDEVELTEGDAWTPWTQDVVTEPSMATGTLTLRDDASLDPDVLLAMGRPNARNTRIPWLAQCSRRMAVMYRGDELHLVDGRTFLVTQIHRLAREHNLCLKIGFEEEFYLLKGDEASGFHPVDASTYCSTASFDAHFDLFAEIADALDQQGIGVQLMHAESGAGQFEIALDHMDVLAACDAHMIAKETIMALSRKHKYRATFVPKLSPQSAGTGAHFHMSIWTVDGGENVTFKSDAAATFLAGIYGHLKALMLVGMPTSNSYARAAGDWTGCQYHAYGTSKNCPMRICSDRVEIKVMDGTANPYFCLASYIVAGRLNLEQQGEDVEEKMKLPEPCEEPTPENSTRLPENLKEALKTFEADTTLVEALPWAKAFLSVRKAEAAIKGGSQLVSVLMERF